MMNLLAKIPTLARMLIIILIAGAMLWWINSLIDLRDNAIKLKDTAANTALQTVKSDLKRSQSQVTELQATLQSKDRLITKLNTVNTSLNNLRNKLESEVSHIRSKHADAEMTLARYKLNYSEEALRDVETTEHVTNSTIADIMRKFEDITSPR